MQRPLTALPRTREATQIAFEDDVAQTPDLTETYDVETYVGGVRNATLSATGVALPYNLRFDLTAINSTDVETRVRSRRTVGNLRSSTAYGFVRYTMAQVYTPGNADHWNTYPGLDGGQIVSVYSLKKRISTYSGPAVRIRDTNDNSEQDVGFDGSGNLAAFTVIGQARVKTVYDQGPAGLNLTQTTASRQPQLLPTGAPNGKPCIRFGSGGFLLTGPSFSNASPNAHLITRPVWFGANLITAGTTYQIPNIIPDTNAGWSGAFYRMGMAIDPDEGIQTHFNTFTQHNWTGAADINVTKHQWLIDTNTDPTKLNVYLNGAATGSFSDSSSFSAPNTTNISYGTDPVFGQPVLGDFMEWCILDGNTSAAMRSAIFAELEQTWWT